MSPKCRRGRADAEAVREKSGRDQLQTGHLRGVILGGFQGAPCLNSRGSGSDPFGAVGGGLAPACRGIARWGRRDNLREFVPQEMRGGIMRHRARLLRDARAHFRILFAIRPSVGCPTSRYSSTPSIFDGVFCVNGAWA